MKIRYRFLLSIIYIYAAWHAMTWLHHAIIDGELDVNYWPVMFPSSLIALFFLAVIWMGEGD